MGIVDLPRATRDLRLGHLGPVLVSCFEGWPSTSTFSALQRAHLELARTHPRVYSLAIVPETPVGAAVGLEQGAREREQMLSNSAAVAARLEAVTAASAMVLLPAGMLGVVLRSFMAALLLTSRSQTKVKTFRALPEAEQWFRAQEGGPPVPEGLAEQVRLWLEARSATDAQRVRAAKQG